MKAVVVVTCAAGLLGGCAIAPSPNGPTALSNDALSGMWTTKPVAVVSQCLATANVAALYRVEDISGKKSVYPTLVTRIAEQDAIGQLAAARCL